MDVWQCASGEPIVAHDATIKRMTGQKGKIEAMSLSELKHLDFGSFSSQRFRGEKIPTLAEALELIKDLDVINIEVKGKRLKSNGLEEQINKLVKDFKLENQVIVSSFNPAILYRMSKINPHIRLGLLCFDRTIRPVRHAWANRWISFYSIHPVIRLLKSSWIKKSKITNEKLIPWTVNHKAEVEICLQHEVEGIITDRPAWLAQTLKIDFGYV